MLFYISSFFFFFFFFQAEDGIRDYKVTGVQTCALPIFDGLFRAGFADPYGAAVVAELQRRGISFVARDPVLVRQFGPTRRFNGHNAKAALLLRTGAATGEAPTGSRRVARGEGLSAGDQRELSRLE